MTSQQQTLIIKLQALLFTLLFQQRVLNQPVVYVVVDLLCDRSPSFLPLANGVELPREQLQRWYFCRWVSIHNGRKVHHNSVDQTWRKHIVQTVDNFSVACVWMRSSNR